MTPDDDWGTTPSANAEEEALLAEAAKEVLRPKPRRPLPAAPDRAPPSSAEAEEHVIACALIDEGETLTRAIQAGVTPAAFYFPANRILWETLTNLHASGKPVMLDTLAEELKTARLLEATGGFSYLMQVVSKVPTTTHAGYFIDKVREKHLLREAISAATRTVEEAFSFTGGIEEFIASAKLRLDYVAKGLQKTEADPSAHRITLSSNPIEPTTRLFLAGKPIATPGNFVTLISKAKTGKTTSLGAIVAAIIAAHFDRKDVDTFKFTAPHTKEAVVLLDTEQSPFDAYTCHKRMFARADQDRDIDWLYHHALVGYTARQLQAALPGIMAAAKAKHGAVFTLILDGVADFVNSVNDEAECNAFIAWLRALSVTYDCPIICVIHSNEGITAGDDGRGHLGKQLMRKAESNLVLKKDGDVTTITSEKQRKAPITEHDKVAFRWDEEAQRHVSCDREASRGPGRPRSRSLSEYVSIFPVTEKEAKTYNALLRLAKGKAPISTTTFWNLVSEGVEAGEIQVNRANVNEPKYWV
jgi:hypothetical protein